jgi:hypothetical protein
VDKIGTDDLERHARGDAALGVPVGLGNAVQRTIVSSVRRCRDVLAHLAIRASGRVFAFMPGIEPAKNRLVAKRTFNKPGHHKAPYHFGTDADFFPQATIPVTGKEESWVREKKLRVRNCFPFSSVFSVASCSFFRKYFRQLP